LAVKTTKKTAKATKKRTPAPKRARMTLEEFVAASEAADKKRDASLSRLEATVAAMAAEHAKTEATLDRLAAAQAKTEVIVADTLKAVKELSTNLGGLNNRIGGLVELIVIPKIRLDMNKAGGYSFTEATPDKRIRKSIDGQTRDIAEVDMFLSGDNEAMAVEIKAHLTRAYVSEHVNRLHKLRVYEDVAGVVGKKLFAAAVGATVDDDARKFAKKNGMYVIEIREEEEKLIIDPPENCKVW